MEDMQSVLEEGAMASPMLKLKGPLVIPSHPRAPNESASNSRFPIPAPLQMAQRSYAPAFPLKYALKDMKFALGLEGAKGLGLPVSRAATAAFEVADTDPALSEADFAAIMEVAANKKKRVGF